MRSYAGSTTVNHMLDVLYPQSVDAFFQSVDRGAWSTLETCPACSGSRIMKYFEKMGFDYWICGTCAHQFLNPMPDPDSLAAWYRDSLSHNAYNDLVNRSDAQRRELFYAKRLRQIKEEVPGVSSIFEVGCGTGRFLDYAARELGVSGCDINEPALATCRELGINAFYARAEDFDFSKVDSDVLCLFEVLEHLPEPAEMLAAIKRSARPGTRILLTTPCTDGFDFKMLGRTYHAYLPPGHINLFCRASMGALLERLGFQQPRLAANGTMDVAVVKGYYENNRFQADPFWQAAFAEDGPFLDAFQALLSSHDLAGNLMAVATV